MWLTPDRRSLMIDHRIVGAIIRGDLSGYSLTADDARIIVRQRIATPVSSLLRDQADAASAEAHEILTAARDKAALQSLLLARTANEASGMLGAADIPALVYKGVAHAVNDVGTWRGRESVDVDVLVPRNRVSEVHAVFSAAGLERADGISRAPSRLMRYHDIEVAYRGLPKTVDLHWRLEAPGHLDVPFEHLWNERQRIDNAGLQIWSPNEAFAVVISAVHGTRERWNSLRLMLDFSAAISGMQPGEWEAVASASSYGSSKSLAVALGVAELCQTPQMPAKSRDWGHRLATAFVHESAPNLNDPTFRRTRPADAVRRRIRRWQLTPRPSAAIDGLLRSAIRQPTAKRSWSLNAPTTR